MSPDHANKSDPGIPPTPTGCCGGSDDARRWKDAPLAQRLFIIHNLMMRTGDRLVTHLGLTSSRWLLLGAVAKRVEPPSLSELSADALLSLQNVSRMVASMEADGLLERFTKPGQGRAVYLQLTPKGREVHEATTDAGHRFVTAFLDGFKPEEVDRMELQLEQLIVNLEILEKQLCQEPATPVFRPSQERI